QKGNKFRGVRIHRPYVVLSHTVQNYYYDRIFALGAKLLNFAPKIILKFSLGVGFPSRSLSSSDKLISTDMVDRNSKILAPNAAKRLPQRQDLKSRVGVGDKT
uniref:Uncharacterized protein n=1 Tax=Megaselia scalaris TaxID=36166 RepID=T1GXT2_MEGSC